MIRWELVWSKSNTNGLCGFTQVIRPAGQGKMVHDGINLNLESWMVTIVKSTPPPHPLKVTTRMTLHFYIFVENPKLNQTFICDWHPGWAVDPSHKDMVAEKKRLMSVDVRCRCGASQHYTNLSSCHKLPGTPNQDVLKTWWTSCAVVFFKKIEFAIITIGSKKPVDQLSYKNHHM